MKIIDETGKRFSRLLVVEKTKIRRHREIVYKCLCDCGNETLVNSSDLRSGNTSSCGCVQRENAIKHGHTVRGRMTNEYKTWAHMVQRCTNPKHKSFKDYGGRGIKVCKEWLHSFGNFLAYLKANNMYPKPAGTSIDRPNNDGHYEPGNIRWATKSQQNYNQRRSRK